VSEAEPVETLVLWPLREEEPRPEDQGAFCRQQPAGALGSLRVPMLGLVSPHAAPSEGALRAVRLPFPVAVPSLGCSALAGENEHLLFHPERLALTNEAIPVTRSAGPRKGLPLVGAGRPQRP